MALYPLLRPLIFGLDAERAHRLTLAALKTLPAGNPPKPDPMLAVQVAGLDFPNPIGLAAGFDKNAEVFAQILRMGFGFAEVGTLTPRPQAGNPSPRLFRLVEDRAVINRMGFNNAGQQAALPRLQHRRRGGGIVGVNIGANKDSADRIADYAAGVVAMMGVADYLTVNISSPNTPGLRALQDKAALDELLAAVTEARGAGPPLFLKVAPDLEPSEIGDVVDVAMARRIDAIIVSNTTISRPQLESRYRGETGGLSGAPLKKLALQRLKDFRAAAGPSLPLIAAGGIENGVDAYNRIRAGASLVQLYSALVYQGPGLARSIASELKRLLRRDGFRTIGEAVGAD
ncbi:quinone-dependent dihydroorotate dehydrogenase [Sphingosinicella humi]|uniref:Dihydroorotate dehydrogenase (quinone) n=1 Tax=Allosphingosinicella humi TaxID=2068657 RepID=A0A2U2J6A4_9SPHN|nr:quinone-dependent dihydroorotate dehydrogenase [Sphingosinicella humi]PWG03864.1 dihydroorotate dehydrogenase (quinone) [Sphingosinicella humi]